MTAVQKARAIIICARSMGGFWPSNNVQEQQLYSREIICVRNGDDIIINNII